MHRTSASARLRRRIVALAFVIAAATAIALVAALGDVDIAERFQDRAQVTKEYDQGVTGRFGNQIRGVPMLIERPNGLGPLRWRLTFGLEPHNSYIGGFANGGWLGGFSFLALVLATGFVGFRLCLTPSPFQRQAQIAWPGLFIFLLQALQIRRRPLASRLSAVRHDLGPRGRPPRLARPAASRRASMRDPTRPRSRQ
jgi:hypothetical protein